MAEFGSASHPCLQGATIGLSHSEWVCRVLALKPDGAPVFVAFQLTGIAALCALIDLQRDGKAGIAAIELFRTSCSARVEQRRRR